MREKDKEIRISTVSELISVGVTARLISTYYCLTDYVNKDGLCRTRMETLAETLNYSSRTIQRHLYLLQDKGLIEFIVRR